MKDECRITFDFKTTPGYAVIVKQPLDTCELSALCILNQIIDLCLHKNRIASAKRNWLHNECVEYCDMQGDDEVARLSITTLDKHKFLDVFRERETSVMNKLGFAEVLNEMECLD